MLGTPTARATAEVGVLHDRSPLFVELSNGDIRNGYTLELTNKARTQRSFDLAVEGLPVSELSVLSVEQGPGGLWRLPVGPDSIATYRIYLRLPRAEAQNRDITLLVGEPRRETVRQGTVFRGPDR